MVARLWPDKGFRPDVRRMSQSILVTERSCSATDSGLLGERMKIVCAYSGGLDAPVMVHWLKENYDAEIITYTGDLGQGDDLPR